MTPLRAPGALGIPGVSAVPSKRAPGSENLFFPGDEAWLDEPDAPPVLALDTSSKVGGVALLRGIELLGEETWAVGGSHTQQVLPAAARLCQRASVQIQELSLVVVATGPGSFTGLRVGASLGKGLVAALGIPLIGVPTLDAVAYQWQSVTGRILALVDAGRGHVYAGSYRNTARGLRREGEFQVVSDEELSGHAGSKGKAVFVAGELAPYRALFLQGLPGVRVASPSAAPRRPANLGVLGYLRWRAGGAQDASALQPLYLKRV